MINPKGKKLGFFGGSFNPPTRAHIELAMQTLTYFNLDQIIFVPVGDQYSKKDLIPAKHRIEMLRQICDGEKLEVSDIELRMNHKLYAKDIFKILSEEYQGNELFFILGSDNLEKMPNWKNSTDLIKNYQYIILERNEDVNKMIMKNELFSKYRKNFLILKTKTQYQTISSTLVRNHLKKKQQIEAFVPEKIENYLKEHKLY